MSLFIATAASAAAQDRPYGGTAWPLPGGVQAEDFNEGGQGVGYYDNSPGNNGGRYRSTDVDITDSTTGGYTVGWIGAGEWLKYTVNATSAGNYAIVMRVASAGTGGTFHIEFNGVNKTGTLRVPNTGGWANYQELPVTVSLAQGVQTMRLVFDTNGPSTGAVGNISFLRFDLASSTPTSSPSTTSAATPFGGSAWAVPGLVQAEDFDQGGEGVAYHDLTAGNTGGAYRTTNVDIATKAGGGYTVGWIGAGEWLKYTVNVSAAGTYTVVARVASAGTGGTFHIEFNGVDKTGALRVPNTGAWGTYQDLRATVSLSAGVQSMRVVFDANGTTGAVGNLSSFTFEGGGTSTTTARTPYGGTARAVPGTIQAEDFDQGGEGVAYHDVTRGNSGGVYRSTDVDIQSTPSGGYTVGWTAAGEWLRYTVNVSTAGTYTLVARVASAGTGGTFHVEFNDQDKTGALRVPNTGGWTTYTDVRATVSLAAGVQTMRIAFDSAGSTGAIGNLHYVRFEAGAVPAPAPTTSTTGGRLRVMTWNIRLGSTNIAGQAQVMANSGAHVILLQEASLGVEYLPTTLPQRLQQLTGQAWYSLWAPHGGQYGPNEGTLILSRLPVLARSTMNAYSRGFSRVLVSVGGVHVNLFSLHLDWYSTSARSAQLEEFLVWSRQFAGPRIAGADMNSWWGEWWIQRMESEYIDTWQDVTGSEENGYTLNGAVRFDYLFRSRTDSSRAMPTACWVTTTSTSDHWPVIADYAIR